MLIELVTLGSMASMVMTNLREKAALVSKCVKAQAAQTSE